MNDPELESFKNIDLRQYAAAEGYEIDRREGSRNSSVMRHKNGDKIIIRRGADNHYIYFSVRDDRDSGTIIDFVQRRLGLSLGAVRKELRPWIHRPTTTLPTFSKLEATSQDRFRVETEYRRMKDLRRHSYLETDRCLPASLFSSFRFVGRIRIDGRGNAIFPHTDRDRELCGYEIKNNGFTGFAAGGEKGLWLSNTSPGDQRFVLAESAIDAISYAVLFPYWMARYASVAGKLNPLQPDVIKRELAKMPIGSEIIAAMDADKEGRALAEIVRRSVLEMNRPDLRFKSHCPDQDDLDWNQVLQNQDRYFPTAQYR